MPLLEGDSSIESSTAPDKSLSQYILIVEDDPVIIQILTDILSSLGFLVLAATSGAEAIRIFEAMSQEIFCIVLDFGLPGMHPARAVSRFRELNKSIKIILSSGYPQGDIINELPLNDIDGFIAKPYNPEELAVIIKRSIY